MSLAEPCMHRKGSAYVTVLGGRGSRVRLPEPGRDPGRDPVREPEREPGPGGRPGAGRT